jgi:hypothetical protein
VSRLEINDRGDCLLGGELLHPHAGALAAASQEVERLVQGGGPADTLVLCGSGLGWHAKAAARGAARVVVYEPDARRRALWASLGPALPEVDIAKDDNGLVEALGRRLIYGPQAGAGRVAVYAPPAYRAAEPGLVARARRLVREALSRASADRRTRASLAGRWLDNLADNFQRVVELPDATAPAGALSGTPALVVGAGPSLDHSLATLAKAPESLLIMAAASALGPLAGAGVRPAAAVALEGSDESRQFAGADHQATWLLAAASGHPAHFSQWRGPKALFHLQQWAARLAGAHLALPTGGHATSAAFSLAVLWGCDPIILVGQDLAYTGGRIHAQGRPGGEEEQRQDMRRVRAIGGGHAQTSAIMHSYISWYQETAAYLARRPVRPRIINATAQGARLEGFEHLQLEQALRQVPAGGGPAPGDALRAAPLPRPEAVSQRCLAAAVEARRAQAVVREQGVAAALDAAAGPAAETLRGLGEAEPAPAAEALARLAAALRRMAEAVYA